MGVNLLLVKDNKILADLGRAYNYYENINTIEKDYETLMNRTFRSRDNVVKKINMYMGYSPPNIEMLLEIMNIIEDELENLRELLVQYGKKLLITSLINNDLEIMTELEYEEKNKSLTS